MRRGGDFVWFCRLCDDQHEAGSWFFWFTRGFQFGIAGERLKDRLRARLRRMLFKETGQQEMRALSLEDAALRSGHSAREVLTRVSAWEAQNGGIRVRGYGYKPKPRRHINPVERRIEKREKQWESFLEKRAFANLHPGFGLVDVLSIGDHD